MGKLFITYECENRYFCFFLCNPLPSRGVFPLPFLPVTGHGLKTSVLGFSFKDGKIPEPEAAPFFFFFGFGFGLSRQQMLSCLTRENELLLSFLVLRHFLGGGGGGSLGRLRSFWLKKKILNQSSCGRWGRREGGRTEQAENKNSFKGKGGK